MVVVGTRLPGDAGWRNRGTRKDDSPPIPPPIASAFDGDWSVYVDGDDVIVTATTPGHRRDWTWRSTWPEDEPAPEYLAHLRDRFAYRDDPIGTGGADAAPFECQWPTIVLRETFDQPPGPTVDSFTGRHFTPAHPALEHGSEPLTPRLTATDWGSADGCVLVYAERHSRGRLFAIDRETGRKRWEFRSDSRLACRETIDRWVLVAERGSQGEWIRAIDLDLGTPVWADPASSSAQVSPSDGEIRIRDLDEHGGPIERVLSFPRT